MTMISQNYVTCNDRLLPLVTGMAGEYAEIVRTLVMEADQQAARALGQKLAKGEALAQVLAERENLVYKPASVRAWMRGDAMPPADVLLAVARSAGISIDEASSRQPEGAQAPGDQRLDSLEGQVARLTEAVQSLQKEAVRERRRAERREWASRSTAASPTPHSPTPSPSSGRSRRI